MQVEEIKNSTHIKPVKLSVKDMPHLTIEPNRTCNMHCRRCYNLNRSNVKSLDEIKKEVDLALTKRNLGIITIVGGEPTIHQNLTEIVSHIKSKNLDCQLLTNGILFLKDENDDLIKKLIQSGVDRILLHVDIGQDHIHKNIDKTRHVLFSKLEKHKINFSLSFTIYKENECLIPEYIKRYSRYRFFDGILTVLGKDPLPPYSQQSELLEEYKSISNELNIEPATFLPSNLDDNHPFWLIYFYFINANTGKTLSISPSLFRIFSKLFRSFYRHHLLAIIIKPWLYPIIFFFTGLIETVMNPRKLNSFLKVTRKSRWLRSVRFHYIYIQTPPTFNDERNQYELCYHCPDATIRNGMLTPVCLADMINPFESDNEENEIPHDLYETVYNHLEEI